MNGKIKMCAGHIGAVAFINEPQRLDHQRQRVAGSPIRRFGARLMGRRIAVCVWHGDLPEQWSHLSYACIACLSPAASRPAQACTVPARFQIGVTLHGFDSGQTD